MTGNTIDLQFGDGEYVFALPIEQINEIQRKCGAGIGTVFGRVTKGCFVNSLTKEVHIDAKLGEFFALDIIETVRHGLIGGGKGVVNGEEIKVTPLLANQLVDAYVLNRPLIDSWTIAVSVLGACIVGYTPPKKDPPASERAPEKPERKKRTTKAG